MNTINSNNLIVVNLPEKIDHAVVYLFQNTYTTTADFLIFDFEKTRHISLAGAMYLICLSGYIKKSKANQYHFHTEIRNLEPKSQNFLSNVGFFSQMLRIGNLYRVNNIDLKVSNEILKQEEIYTNYHLRNTNPNSTLIMPIEPIIYNNGSKETFEADVKRFRNDFIDFFIKLSQFDIFQNNNQDGNFQEEFDGFNLAVFEIMKNIFDHSESWGIGGIYANKKNGLQICYYDIGVGVIESVKKNKSILLHKDEEILDWAMKDGNSSKSSDQLQNQYNFGRGFTIIKDFTKKKAGLLSIRTGMLHRLPNGRIQRTNPFPGTQIVIYLNLK